MFLHSQNQTRCSLHVTETCEEWNTCWKLKIVAKVPLHSNVQCQKMLCHPHSQKHLQKSDCHPHNVDKLSLLNLSWTSKTNTSKSNALLIKSEKLHLVAFFHQWICLWTKESNNYTCGFICNNCFEAITVHKMYVNIS